MTPLVALLVAAPQSAAAMLDASAKAHAALRRFNVVASVETRSDGHRTRVDYAIVSDGENVLLRIKEGATLGRARSDRTFLFGTSRVVAYDAVARQRLTRPLPAGARRLGRVIFTLGPVDDLVRFLLDGSQMAEFYGNFRSLSGWKVASTATGTNLSRDVAIPGGRNRTSMRFAPKTRLLTALSIETPSTGTRWQIRYGSLKKPSLSIPADARSVSAFTVAPQPPKYGSRDARRLTDAMLSAYRRLSRGVVTVRDDAGTTKIVLDRNRLREENPFGAYAYDGKTLTILDRRRRTYYRGATARTQVPSLVAAAGGRVDPLSRQRLLGKTPLQELLVPEMTINTGGSVNMDGVDCDILRFDSARSRVTLFVRRDNRFLDGASTNTLDRSGRPILTTARRFKYSGLGRPQAASQFTIGKPNGYAAKGLPKLGR